MHHSLGKVGIALIGPSGTGKSTVGKLLALELGLDFHDMDDDGLEGEWGPGGVADYLLKHGDDEFLAAEEQFTLDSYGRHNENKKYVLDNMLFGTSGSIVLEPRAMNYIRERMIVIYLRAPMDEIERRLDARGINRIVGMNGDHPRFKNVHEVLEYRREFYESSADIICHLDAGSSPEDDAIRIKAFIEKYIIRRTNGTYSTHSLLQDSRSGENASLRHAIVSSQPDSGGLWTPTTLPSISLDEIEAFGDMSYGEIASSILTRFNFGVNAPVLREVIGAAYGPQWNHRDITPLRKMGEDNIFALHLGYGPTFAFKNIALEFLPRILEKIAPEKSIHVLGASSGDTINAAHSGVKGTKIKSLFMLPGVGPSRIQRLQAIDGIRNNPNALTIVADIPFDPLQDIVKQINSPKYAAFKKEHGITSFNSINIARILAQVVYYFRAYSKLVKGGFVEIGQPITFSVPSGNFGNALAGFYAKLMGLPVGNIHIATNENDMLDTFFKTGRYEPPKKAGKDFVAVTNAPSMDIAKSSNLERLIFEACGQDAQKLKSWYQELADTGSFQVDTETLAYIQASFSSGSSTNTERINAIKKWLDDYGYPIDPHTAAGVVPIMKKEIGDDGIPVVFLETSHVIQFKEELEKVGILFPDDPLIDKSLDNLEQERGILGKDYLEIKDANFESLFTLIQEGITLLDTGKK